MLRQRVGTALVLAPIGILAVLYLSTPQFWWLLGFVFAVGGWEWTRLLAISNTALRLLTALVLALAVAGGAWLESPTPVVTGTAGSLVWVIAALWLARSEPGSAPSGARRVIKGLYGLILMLISAYALGTLFAQEHGRYWLLLLLLLIWAADIGAYFAGQTLGRHKLAPQVSPGKTWEGVVGGLLLASAVALVASQWMTLRHGQMGQLLAVGLVTVMVSIVGDLFISLMKRQAGLKDAGRLFPGHGGVLDRFDSLIAAAPIFLLGKHLMGL